MTGWRDHAACRGLDPALFYPVKGEGAGPGLAVCQTCPVRPDCYIDVLSRPGLDKEGTWAGLSARQRRRIRRRCGALHFDGSKEEE